MNWRAGKTGRKRLQQFLQRAIAVVTKSSAPARGWRCKRFGQSSTTIQSVQCVVGRPLYGFCSDKGHVILTAGAVASKWAWARTHTHIWIWAHTTQTHTNTRTVGHTDAHTHAQTCTPHRRAHQPVRAQITPSACGTRPALVALIIGWFMYLLYMQIWISGADLCSRFVKGGGKWKGKKWRRGVTQIK